MPSNYLQADEFDLYGLPTATTVAQVQQASIVLDAYLKRPEGLVYTTDNAGMPVCMRDMPASATVTLTSALSPGQNAAASANGPLQMLRSGTVLVADKSTPASAEALVVASVVGGLVYFQRVTKPHASGTVLEAGLVIEETKHLPTGRMQTLLSRTPVVSILSIEGQYGPSRRGRPSNYGTAYDDYLISSMNVFAGGSPVPELVNMSGVNFDSVQGLVWLPSGLFAPTYTDVSFRYIAGFPDTAVPSIIKQVTANLILAQSQSKLRGNIKVFRAGDTQIERFVASLLGDDDKGALADYKARVYG